MSASIPRKGLYKLGEVCQLTDTQPYVLRFWESEFPQLAPRKSRTGQRLYRQKDVDLVLQIKRLLYEDGFTIASARKKLGLGGGAGALDDLFEPSPVEDPDRVQEPARPLGTVLSTLNQNLEEILEIMETTDRRLKEKK